MRFFRFPALIVFFLFSTSALADLNFPQPRALGPAVDFWTRVYTELDDNAGFIHDDRRMNDVVYGSIRFQPKSSRRSQQKQIKAEVRQWKNALLNMASGKSSKVSQRYQKVIRKIWGANASAKTLRNAAHRVRFQRGQANKFRAGVIRSGAFEGHIAKVMRDLGLPADLGLLPHVESSFNPLARSHVGAAGMWQFTRGTGRRFMRIDHVVDERLDPYKASHAAGRLLKHNHSVLGTWPLALTAYNHGLGGMRKAVRVTGTKDMGVIAQRYRGRLFGFASRNFYAAFLAARRVAKNHEKYFGPLKRHTAHDVPVVSIPLYVPVRALSQHLGVSTKELQRLNPALQRTVWSGDKLVPRNFTLRLPGGYSIDKAEERIRQATIAAGAPRQKRDYFYRVRKGDTLSRIAARFGTSTRTLMSLNGLRSANRIRIGQRLRLPGAQGTTLASSAVTPPDAAPGRTTIHKVRRGEVLALIAQRYGVSTRDLMRANRIRSANRIYAGQILTIPAPGVPEPLVVAKAPQATPGSRITTTLHPASGSKRTLPPSPQSATSVAEPGGEEASEAADTPPETKGEPDEEQRHEQEADLAATASSESDSPTTAAAEDATDEVDTAETGVAPVEAQPALAADPADYEVAPDGTIEVQAAETLGHFAEWLGIKTQRLREVNRLSYGKPISIGKRIRLDTRRVTTEEFVKRRVAYHQELQAAFFETHRIAGTRDHKVRKGDSLWGLANRSYEVPLWLLRQYNPDKDLAKPLPPGGTVEIPVIIPVKES
ncbi:MAG: LysM peptidoglycan-binding domain-containing protein [Gammaproteobacteria bacterium]